MKTKKLNILITGSEGMIGRSLANFLKKKKQNIFKIDIKKTQNDKNFFRCDITRECDVKKTVKKILSKTNIDVLINNAAYNPKFNSNTFSFTEYSLDSWKKNIEVDLIGSFLMSKYICRNFEKKK